MNRDSGPCVILSTSTNGGTGSAGAEEQWNAVEEQHKPAEERLRNGQRKRSIAAVSNLEGTLLRDTSFFPYYMLVAMEAGSLLRALLLLLVYPITLVLSDGAAVSLSVFVATAGLPLAAIRGVAAAVLPKFFLEDLDHNAYRALVSVSPVADAPPARRCVVTSHPHALVDHFLRKHLLVESIIATDLQVTKAGICTGFLTRRATFLEHRKMEALRVVLADSSSDGYGVRAINGENHAFLSLCKETFVFNREQNRDLKLNDDLPRPIIFHDGRFVRRPTPLVSLAVLLWLPAGVFLLITRLLLMAMPQEIAFPVTSLFGVRLRVKGAPPLVLPNSGDQSSNKGVVFVCVHRSLADPIFLAMALRRKVRALVFSVSQLSQLVSPVRTTRLTRNREKDAQLMEQLLQEEDLCICPEGTTCREPFVLRFSPLFAELADHIVPVAVKLTLPMFHGTTARGYKSLDMIFLALNPTISYEIHFLDPICVSELRENGMSATDIANMVQKKLSGALGYQCTSYSRRDKYSLLAGHDGVLQWS